MKFNGGDAEVVFADAHGVNPASLRVWPGDHRVLEVGGG